MLFNSIDFAVFLPIVFILYWFLFSRHLKLQNIFILVASYFFYAWWNWHFLGLIIFSSIVDFIIGISLNNTIAENKRKALLMLSVFINLGFLMYFKYYNFFIDSFIDAFTFFGGDFSANHLNVILPVGISFYTFQTLSYSIDVYRRKLEPTKDFISFFAYISFFPQLVAGPIERAKNLLPQFYVSRKFDSRLAGLGMRQILWGLFKKVVIADNCAPLVQQIFNNYQELSTLTLIFGAVLFAFQIYCDFSGYSDIAIGVARLLGFNLMQNFRYPYFSRDIAEFWRRWHISLSTWFRDYLYIPLGGSRGSLIMSVRNVLIIFIVSGFWHGANWTFILWGTLNAIYFLPSLLTSKNRKNIDEVGEGRILPSFLEFVNILKTFMLTCLAWIFFWASDVSEAFDYISHLVINIKVPLATDQIISLFINDFWTGIILVYIGYLIFIEWRNRKEEFGLNFSGIRNGVFDKIYRWSTYFILVIIIVIEFPNAAIDFIYFQF